MNNRIFHAIKLDFYTLKSTSIAVSVTVIAVIISLVIGAATKQPAFTIGFFMVLTQFVSGTIFSTNEKSRSDRLYGVLPLRKNEMIAGRYVYALIIGVISLVIAIILTLLVSRLFGANASSLLFFIALAAAFAYYCFAVGVTYPLYLRFSFSKAYVYTMLPIYFIFLIGMFLARRTNFLSNIDQSISFFSDKQPLILVIGVAVGLALLAASAFIANRIYKRKEI